MVIKKYDSSYYNQLKIIWSFYGWKEPVPEDFLPDGYVALTNEGKFIAAYFMYIAPNKGAFLAWPVCALRYTKEEKDIAFKEIIARFKEDAKIAGVKLMLAMSKSNRVKDILQYNGLCPAEKETTSFALDLQNNGLSFISD
jgi:hypothetical protein